MSGVLYASLTGEGPIEVGTKFRKVQRFYGLRTEMVYHVTEYDPNRRLGYETCCGPLFYRASITLQAVEGDADLIYHGRAKLSGLLKLAEPVFALVARGRFSNDFRKLKAQLEARA
jgi:hypothetical protein